MTIHKWTPKHTKTTMLSASIIFLIGFSRYLPLDFPFLYNFSPAIAVFWFCGGYFKGHFSWIAPVLAILISDLLLNPSYGNHLWEPFMIATLLSYSLIWFFGKKFGRGTNFKPWIFGAIASAILFHVVTCSFAWLINPAYSKTLHGLIQAIIIGEPGYAPSYLFLRNSILSTFFFSIALRWTYIWALSLSPEEESLPPSSSSIHT
jgi:hypothetical protein